MFFIRYPRLNVKIVVKYVVVFALCCLVYSSYDSFQGWHLNKRPLRISTMGNHIVFYILIFFRVYKLNVMDQVNSCRSYEDC